jgi:protein-L-isoaspartate(D-aspartate) O-methyltransferase
MIFNGGAGMDLADLRRVYARQVLTLANALNNASLEAAYAAVPRERFLGRGEWRINTPWSIGALIPNDPVLIYQDVVVALDRERGVNNGSPSLHAHWLDVVAPGRGEHVAHIGAGTGYYSAILAELVGDGGRVTSIEFDATLAAHAQRNLAGRPNVSCIKGNGFDWPQEAVDVVYVNFAASRPAGLVRLCRERGGKRSAGGNQCPPQQSSTERLSEYQKPIIGQTSKRRLLLVRRIGLGFKSRGVHGKLI